MRKAQQRKSVAKKWIAPSEEDSVQTIARQYGGVTVHEVDVYQRLSHDTFVQLATNFYDRVYADDSAWFKSVFAYLPKEEAIQNQCEFLIQKMGGPALYSTRKGHPVHLGRQMRPFAVTERAVERWLQHMKDALDSVDSIDADSKVLLWDFFKTWCTESLQCRDQFEFSFPWSARQEQISEGGEITSSKEAPGENHLEDLKAAIDDVRTLVKDSPGDTDWAYKTIEELVDSVTAFNLEAAGSHTT